jgi:hypothetical protein
MEASRELHTLPFDMEASRELHTLPFDMEASRKLHTLPFDMEPQGNSTPFHSIWKPQGNSTPFRLLPRNQYVTGRPSDRTPRHRFSWFSSVFKRILRWFPGSELLLPASYATPSTCIDQHEPPPPLYPLNQSEHHT